FVANFQIVPAPEARTPRRKHTPAPVSRLSLYLLAGREPHLPQRECGVAPVAYEMNEARLWQHTSNRLQLITVKWCLVAPTGFTEACGIQTIECPVAFGESERIDLVQRSPENFFRYLEIQPSRFRLRIIDDRPEEFFSQLIALPPGLRFEAEKACLRRDCYLRVRIQHEPQQGRPGPGRADNNWHRGEARIRRIPASI